MTTIMAKVSRISITGSMASVCQGFHLNDVTNFGRLKGRRQMKNSVALVLDESFGNRLSNLAEEMPVWILSSEINDMAVRAARHSHGEGRITTLMRRDGESQEDLLARALYAIEEHHGEVSQSHPYDSVEIHGPVSMPSQLCPEFSVSPLQ
ncbi:hypothetical protein [Mesoterricola silvestris]|uniref:hypothetical protein n=1 Tax=Mesoterricola silvestris TaxID=2927979 RepID=UPI0029305B47|nr:hypothetical protein [Mesoterricola silvestris]